MENTQRQETDVQILLRFIAYCAGTYLLVPHMWIVQEALRLLEIHRTKVEYTPSAKRYIQIAHSNIEIHAQRQLPNKIMGCLVAAVIYILIRTDNTGNEREEQLAIDIYRTLSATDDIRFDNVVIGRTIQQIQQYKQTAPPTYNPFKVVDEIAKGKNLTPEEWQKLLSELDKYYNLFGRTYSYYMMLHGFMMQIPFPTYRANALGHLQTAAEQIFSPTKAKDFTTQASWLVSLYTKINTRGISHPVPHYWTDPDLNEFAMLMETISPQELVSIAQSMIEAKQITHEKFGFIPHILRQEKYGGKIVTNSGFDFCRGLYYAEGAREWLINGETEQHHELPTLDTHDLEFINQCYDLFVSYQIERIRKNCSISEQRLKKESEYYEELLKNLRRENSQENRQKYADILTQKAYDSLFARLRDLMSYVTQRMKMEQTKEELLQLTSKKPKQKFCTYIVPNSGKTRDEIEEDLIRASQKSANTFVRLLLSYEENGYLDFREESPADIFEYLKDRYNLKYSLGNFTRYFKL
jgi:hypothetical protein